MTRHELGEAIFDRLKSKYEAKEQLIGDQAMRFHERMIMLSVIDGLWKDHLLNMDHLKEGIGLRGYGQQDPLVAYKKESFEMFEGMMERFQEDTVRFLFLMKIVGPDGQPVEIPARPRPEIPAAPDVASADGAGGNGHRVPSAPPVPLPPSRTPSTTIDELEKEFERKKKRELEHARMAGGGDASAPAAAPHRRKGGPQRSLPLRFRQEIQEVPRRGRGITAAGTCGNGKRCQPGLCASLLRKALGAGAPILVDDAGQDDEKGAGAHQEDPGTGLAGMREEDAKAAIDAFDEKCQREREEERIARILPEAQKEDAGDQRLKWR